MDTSNILNIVVGLIGSIGGLLGVLQWVNTRKAERKRSEAEAEISCKSVGKVENEANKQIFESYEELLNRYENRFIAQDEKITALEIEINAIKPKICNKTNCLNRE